MVRDDFIALCAGSLMATTWAGYRWFITPEPVESKLAKVRINALLIPQRPVSPGIKAFECVIVHWPIVSGATNGSVPGASPSRRALRHAVLIEVASDRQALLINNRASGGNADVRIVAVRPQRAGENGGFAGVPTGNRTRVFALKGRCPNL
jgi:hypothetical protein